MVVGRRFGKVVVLQRAGSNSAGRTWLCLCDCGKEVVISTLSLNRNKTKGVVSSCGCQKGRNTAVNKTEHGCAIRGSVTRTYYQWQRMKRICYNRNDAQFRLYGGKGISVCPEWREDFRVFLHDMGEVPDGYALERKRQHRRFDKSNCKWMPTGCDVRKRKRQKLFVTHNGVTKSLAEWATDIGIPYETLRARLVVYRMPISKAMEARDLRL